jgi:hypothetical protein
MEAEAAKSNNHASSQVPALIGMGVPYIEIRDRLLLPSCDTARFNTLECVY